ncbi:MAG: hypothetical protein CVV42_14175 [Candidatus Riflebacteria bacterium HGW-Riflebacteria-2]|nr:MAG: hypothetical protein CVV42_14175 [Candidatus Riflebacteria bacterium HGW-Riflebacteria-2]
MTGVLHTNSRQLDFHPHIHYIVPTGAIEPEKRLWKRSKDHKYLFPQHALSSVFRARLVMLLRSHDLVVSEAAFSKDWIIDCEYAGL